MWFRHIVEAQALITGHVRMIPRQPHLRLSTHDRVDSFRVAVVHDHKLVPCSPTWAGTKGDALHRSIITKYFGYCHGNISLLLEAMTLLAVSNVPVGMGSLDSHCQP